jgi:Kef-type K+ transport system membrane component KefB
MVAGILLGPSLFGLLAPNVFNFIFAVSSLDTLRLLSQIGVCLFLFTVGMELDVLEVRHKAQTAVVVSHSSIVIPYFLGVTLALFLYSHLAQAIAARLTGMDWRGSLQLGALMNTRGLMELIALNIGYDMGILSHRIFNMLVIMALVTTVMTGPLVTLFGKTRQVSPA